MSVWVVILLFFGGNIWDSVVKGKFIFEVESMEEVVEKRLNLDELR